MEKSDLDRLVKQLGTGNFKCILVLGPEFINIDRNEADFTESIQDYLAKKELSENIRKNYFSEDGFLYVDNGDADAKYDILQKISGYYESLPLTESYEKLARIPFTSIISLSPDDLIVKAYNKIEKKNTFCRFRKDGFEDGPTEVTKTSPMIYNLMGKYDDTMELVFTFDNLFAFLNKLFQDTGFDFLRRHIKDADNFLFLGFTYHKWYLKLIFYFLTKVRNNNPHLSSNAIFNYKNKEVEFISKIEYYKASHKLKFSPENEKQFIDDLFNACRETGILSSVNALQGVNADLLTAKKKEKYRILFFTASPEGKMVLRAGEKLVEIEEAIKKDFYQLLRPKYRLKRSDIQSEVNNNEPHLLYFNCHGNEAGELVLSDENNKPANLPLEELKEIIVELVVLHTQINCIVFAACKSEKQAQEISKVVPYCVGMNKTVYEEVSDLFTKGFFEAFIRDNQNFEYAFNMGVLAIKNCDKAELREYHTIPVLYKNGIAYKKAQ